MLIMREMGEEKGEGEGTGFMGTLYYLPLFLW